MTIYLDGEPTTARALRAANPDDPDVIEAIGRLASGESTVETIGGGAAPVVTLSTTNSPTGRG